MAKNRTKRPHLNSAEQHAQPSKRTRTQVDNSSSQPTALIENDTPSYSRTSFCGLPAELRLHIYSFLCDETIIHVHHHERKKHQLRFTWTACRGVSSFSPLLCANPKWSGMCKEQDRCTFKQYAPPELQGFWGLAAASKSIRAETQEFFIRKTAVSIHPLNLKPWLNYLTQYDAKTLQNLRRITLAGPIHDIFDGRGDCIDLLRERVPHIEGVGLQCQDAVWNWMTMDQVRMDPERWKAWLEHTRLQEFDDSVTIATEAMIWRNGYRWVTNMREQQIAVRIGREGDADAGKGGHGKWKDADVRVEIDQPGKLGEPRKTGIWRQWWYDVHYSA